MIRIAGEPTELPERIYYRLSEAADILGCKEDDLLHWGATSQTELITVIPEMTKAIYFSGCEWPQNPTIGRGDYIGSEGVSYYCFDEDNTPQIQGAWEIGFYFLARIELLGYIEENQEIDLMAIHDDGDASDWEESEPTPPKNFDNGAFASIILPHKITIKQLFIMADQLEFLISGKNANNKSGTSESKHIRKHGNSERFATARESVLKAAIYCKDKWPEQCNGYRSWAKLIDDKAPLFWPKDGKPPLSLERIERMLGQACKVDSDVQ